MEDDVGELENRVAADVGVIPGHETAAARIVPATQLRHLHNVRQNYLRLEHMALGDDGAVALADELASGAAAERMRSLYLSSNGIGDEGARALAAALRSRPACRLRCLYMDDNLSIGRAAAEALHAACNARSVALVGLGPPRPFSPPPMPLPPSPPRPTSAPFEPTTARLPPPPPPTVGLLPCNRRAAPGPMLRRNENSAGAAASAGAFLPLSRLHAPRAISRPRGGATEPSRYRATRPRSAARLDLIGCTRRPPQTGGAKATKPRVRDEPDGDAQREQREREQREQREREQAAQEQLRALKHEQKRLLDQARQREKALREAPFAHRIPWYQRK
jgi:hypothetical protein